MEEILCNSLKRMINEISSMSASSLKLLCDNMSSQELSKGEPVLKEGQACRNIYFIQSGQLRTFYMKEGREININFTFENNFVTNLKSFLSGEPSAYYIKAGERTMVWKFNNQQLSRLYSQSWELESFGRKLLERLLVKQVDHGNLFKIYTPSERYHYIATHYPELMQRVSLSQLSSFLGMSRETISRIRKEPVGF